MSSIKLSLAGRIPAAHLRRGLLHHAEALFRDIWGEPHRPHAARWRPRRDKPGDDPRRMVMVGPERGLWYDSARGQGGDLFDFIAVERLGLTAAWADFARVAAEVERWLGSWSATQLRHSTRHRREPPANNALDGNLAAILAAAKPLAGRTRRYWLETRGLDPPPCDTVLSLPQGALARRPTGSPLPFAEREAVLVLGRDSNGNVRAMQRILLAPTGTARDPTLPKFALGPIGTYPPFFAPRSRDAARGILVLAEGPETGGAIWSATGARVLVCGGGIARRLKTLTHLATVIVAVEADAPGSPASKALTRAVAEARAAGAVIELLHCGGPPGSGYDAADLIQEEGGRARLRALVADLADRLHRRRRR